MSDARRVRLTDGRWHFQHGPIDLVLGADGAPDAATAFAEAAWTRMQSILAELVQELVQLRAPVQEAPLRGRVARRMQAACLPHRGQFITPMAAVAGAVADELIELAQSCPGLQRAHVNDGGDIALHLAPGTHYRIGMFADLARIERRERWRLDGDAQIDAEMPVRGVATSGWRGRSFSLGIADSVTVLARTAAEADAAATMIANAIDIEHPDIARRPASSLKDDSDLGDRLVTVAVPALPQALVQQALERGARHARELVECGLIVAAVSWLQGAHRVVGCTRPIAVKSCTFQA